MIEIIYLAIIFAFSITIHEYAHAWMANHLGDPTPRLQWRLTLNPLKHIDPFWFLLIFIIRFWRWNPVEINPRYFKNPIRDEFYVAIAGPLSNIVMMLFSIIIVLFAQNIEFLAPSIDFWTIFGILNASMAVFNMIPLPALDWFRIIKLIFPEMATRMQFYTWKYSWISFIVIYILARFLSPYIALVSRGVYYFFYLIISSRIV